MGIEDLRSKLNDNARRFVDFPETVFFDDLADHIAMLPGCEITEFEADGVIGAWIEFEYEGHHFFVDNLLGSFRFHVEDPKCDDSLLLKIIDHLSKAFGTEELDDA